MIKITYIDFEGTERVIEAIPGQNLMETALNNDVPGIDADCGGACACATCHVYIDNAYLGKLPEKDDIEDAMVSDVDNVQDNSRLACQVVVTEDLDGLRVFTPESQC